MNEKLIISNILEGKGKNFEQLPDMVENYSPREREIIKYATEKMIERENRNISVFHAVTPLVLSFIIALIKMVFDGIDLSEFNMESIVNVAALFALAGCIVWLFQIHFKATKSSEKRYTKYLEIAIACCAAESCLVSQESVVTEMIDEKAVQVTKVKNKSKSAILKTQK